MFDATDGGPAVAEMAGITGGSFVLNGVTWHHENDVAKLKRERDEAQRTIEAIRGSKETIGMMDLQEWHDRALELESELAEAKASPSLPDVKSPEALRFAADVALSVGWMSTVSRFHVEADRLEREQAAKTAQDHAIEQAAHVIHEAYGREWCDADDASRRLNRARAQALADAGLLNTKHGDGSGSEPKCGEA